MSASINRFYNIVVKALTIFQTLPFTMLRRFGIIHYHGLHQVLPIYQPHGHSSVIIVKYCDGAVQTFSKVLWCTDVIYMMSCFLRSRLSLYSLIDLFSNRDYLITSCWRGQWCFVLRGSSSLYSFLGSTVTNRQSVRYSITQYTTWYNMALERVHSPVLEGSCSSKININKCKPENVSLKM